MPRIVKNKVDEKTSSCEFQVRSGQVRSGQGILLPENLKVGQIFDVFQWLLHHRFLLGRTFSQINTLISTGSNIGSSERFGQ